MTSSLTPPVSATRRASTTGLIGSTVDGDWTANAACRDLDPDELFVQGAAQNRVKTRCFGCVVRTQCLADALDNRVEFGVWGGMTERERRALLRRRPDVDSWRKLLADAQADHRTASVG
jgi:WhiB family transcriptional regulator, redox-sensing transcriptional regulator